MNWKRKIQAVMVMILAMLIAGCSLVSVNEEKDRGVVVAEVNGKKILKGELLDQFDLYKSAYGVSESQEKEVKTSILEQLVTQEVAVQKAKAAGYDVTEQLKAEAAEELEKEIKEYAESLKKDAKEEDKNNDFEKQARDIYDNWISSMGFTRDQYIDRVAQDMAIRKYMDEQTKDINVEDKEIEDYYNEQVKTQTEHPSYISYYPIKLVDPAMVRVKHILIKISDDDKKEIDALRTDKKDEEAVKLRDEKLKSIQEKADSVLEKAKAGENFEALIDKYGEDPGMESEANKDGYIVLRDSSFMAEFLEASLKLKEDEISGLVATDYGYHIIKAYEVKDEDTVTPLADVNEQIKDTLLSNKKNEKSNELVEGWVKDAKVKKYENRF